MTWNLAGYIADVAILAAYARLVLTGKDTDFNLANATMGPVLIGATVATVGWIPVLWLTVVFTILGWVGLARALYGIKWFPPLGDGTW